MTINYANICEALECNIENIVETEKEEDKNGC